MARTNRISITFCASLFTTLPSTPMAHAPERARESPATTHITKKADKKRSTVTTQKTQKVSRKTAKEAASESTTESKAASSVKKSSITTSRNAKAHSKHAVNETASVSFTKECIKRKGYKSHCVKVKNAASGTLADAHKAKVQEATKVTMSKLMQQTGGPYRWGGSSSRTGLDCSGLVYYAYRDLMEIRIPRTTNEMYHLRDAAPVGRSELRDGDLVFFRTQGRGTADRISVYVGSDKFIQSPCTGQEVQITSLSEGYQQRHYVDARRVMTPKILR